MKLYGFNWDAGNINKVQKHGLSIQEIEEFINSDPYVLVDNKHGAKETRFIAFGKSNKR